jgi:2-oxoisovalerate dehydrogenase E2 component (dihydrolipoyl transacylase)
LQIGGTYAKPVIMPPEVAIGAIGRVQVIFKYINADFFIQMIKNY